MSARCLRCKSIELGLSEIKGKMLGEHRRAVATGANPSPTYMGKLQARREESQAFQAKHLAEAHADEAAA